MSARNDTPLLTPCVENETAEGLILNTGVEIIVATNSYRAVRGRTLLCAILDEVSPWRDETSAYPDTETYNAILPGLVTLPNSMLIDITTAYRRSGLAFEKFKRYFGVNDPDILVIHAPSRAFNSLLPQEVIDQALERDPEAAAAEWLSQWRSDIADFVSREIVEAAVERGCYERPSEYHRHYVAFVDPSGGSADSMTLAIAHHDPVSKAAIIARRSAPRASWMSFATRCSNTGSTKFTATATLANGRENNFTSGASIIDLRSNRNTICMSASCRCSTAAK